MDGATGVSFHRDEVTRVRATATTDRYGDQVSGWDTPDELTISGCRLVPMASDEQVVDRNQVTTRWRLFLPVDADVLATDRIRFQGDEYEISGEVMRWRSASGRLAHAEVELTRVEG